MFSPNSSPGVFVILLQLILFALLIVNFQFVIKEDKLFLLALNKQITYFDLTGNINLLATLRTISPTKWIIFATQNNSFYYIIYLIIFSLVTLIFSFFITKLLFKPNRVKQKKYISINFFKIFFLKNSILSMTFRNIRYFLKTIEVKLGLTLSILFLFYILGEKELSIYLLYIYIPIIFLIHMSIVFNTFGLDYITIDRIRLYPISNIQILLSKNLAYVIIIFSLTGFHVLVYIVKLNFFLGLAIFFGELGVMFLYIIWGNISSILIPAPKSFSSFGGNEQTGGIISQLFGVFIWFLPNEIIKLSDLNMPIYVFISMFLFGLVCFLLYIFLLPKSAHLFSQEGEYIKKRFSLY